MKKLLFTAGTVAVLALASCSNDEIVQSDPNAQDSGLIRYSLVTSNSTRANTYYQSGMAVTQGFNVFARFNNATPTASLVNQTYIDDDFVAYNPTNETYDPENERYWPSSEVLDFLARSGKNWFGTTETVSFSGGEVTLSNIALNPDATEQQDMLYAVTPGIKNSDVQSVVPFNFRHALAQLAFKFKCINKNLSVTVDEVRIVNIDNHNGTVKFSTDTYGTAGSIQYLENGTVIYGNQALCDWTGSTPNYLKSADGTTKVKVDYKTVDGVEKSVSRLNWGYGQVTGAPTTLGYKKVVAFSEEQNTAALIPTESQVSDAITEATKDENAADLTDEAKQAIIDAKALTADGGAYAAYITDGEVDAAKIDAARAAAQAADIVANQKARKANALYVIPQNVDLGSIDDKGTETVDGKVKSKTHLSDVSGMYFLIKCSIQNVAGASVTANDIYLHGCKPADDGSDSGTRFVLIPVTMKNYNEANDTESDSGITAWEAGRKYTYTFIFGAPGSNIGVPVDPTDEEINEDEDDDNPDIDPDDDNPITPTDPTLSIIKYTVTKTLVDDWADGGSENVNVNYDKTTDAPATDYNTQNADE